MSRLGRFGYKPDASPLYLATAGRLARAVPVVSWYFLDEIRLRRCPVHQGGGALFRTFCAECEAAASATEADATMVRRLTDAAAFMDRELAAVAQTKRLGRPIEHQWATINLCSDGIAYAHAHGARLRSDVLARYAERFLPGGVHLLALDELEQRVGGSV